MDLYERIIELSSMGYHCSQMVMIMTLEAIGEENPQLVKALGGLGGWDRLLWRYLWLPDRRSLCDRFVPWQSGSAGERRYTDETGCAGIISVVP